MDVNNLINSIANGVTAVAGATTGIISAVKGSQNTGGGSPSVVYQSTPSAPVSGSSISLNGLLLPALAVGGLLLVLILKK